MTLSGHQAAIAGQGRFTADRQGEGPFPGVLNVTSPGRVNKKKNLRAHAIVLPNLSERD